MSTESTELLLRLVSTGQIGDLEKLLTDVQSLNVNDQDKYGNFAAIIAARRNDLPMLKLLVKYGAKLDATDGLGRTVKGWAENNENNDMVGFVDEILSQNSNQEGAKTLLPNS